MQGLALARRGGSIIFALEHGFLLKKYGQNPHLAANGHP